MYILTNPLLLLRIPLRSRLRLQGESGQTKLHGAFSSMDPAEKEFEKKFSDKTKNKWQNRDNFVPAAGKYTLLDMGDEEDDDDQVCAVVKLPPWTKKKKEPSCDKRCSIM